MQSIEKKALLAEINFEISKLKDYDPTIQIIDVSVNANGLIDYFLSNQYESPKLFLALEYMEQIDHIFQGKYNRIY
ncbi:hypothetical protein P7L54_13240 [Acinetobacter bereziniae]|uniref:Uncharacterized protein n=1 Tax=Acinetobacter bereziniae LMG 1003 = CIP 70.12 TaxID=981324 RepID=N9EVB0_ACIBZ|nr:hypothetical protein [Acinetobacter bereziniae]ENV96618.1 hypothetical protein F938_02179 [Acinetobacter bereziniae LMG 1003 = CIP 70.12]MBJ9907739.1 hypothetical protein [Acinetobacter bereziniae]MBJ9929078.1 hypothetical protein [Acinetobacter bereziniae]MDG3556912.1 hypothetical protein [Acinetobacter bereziniae]MDP6002705.1 hypothetical protein [Acinetobacter bereziniae]